MQCPNGMNANPIFTSDLWASIWTALSNEKKFLCAQKIKSQCLFKLCSHFSASRSSWNWFFLQTWNLISKSFGNTSSSRKDISLLKWKLFEILSDFLFCLSCFTFGFASMPTVDGTDSRIFNKIFSREIWRRSLDSLWLKSWDSLSLLCLKTRE